MNKNLYRLPLMLSALVILIMAAWAGLLRLGWQLPTPHPNLNLKHGPLMIPAFFGTLISLERAVAQGKAWAYPSPILSGIGGLLIAFGVDHPIGPILITLGSFWLVLIFFVVLQKHFTGYTLVMALGALALVGGNLLWLTGWSVSRFVIWWAAFLILTITGERLELSRLVKISSLQKNIFNIIVVSYLIGLVVLLFAWQLGVRMTSAGVLAFSLWLLRNDIARRTIQQTGLTRFIAVSMLAGYVWLAVSGVIGLLYGAYPAGPIYDAMLHAIFVGFVFSMIFAHAPIIFPAILGLKITYRSTFYYPLILLHLSLLLRIGGDMLGWDWARLWGGMFNEVAVFAYLVLIAPIKRVSQMRKL